MTWEDQIAKELATKYNLSTFVVQHVIKSPFQFMKDKMSSLEDTRSIRLPYFGIFIYRDYRYPGVNKQIMLLQKAIHIIKDELRENHSDEYKAGLKHAENILRDLIIERKGKPADYGFDEEIK
jgi:hypothetical protein